MKPIPFKVIHDEDASFSVKHHEAGPTRQLHFHPEVQLSLILKGKGVCILGNWMDQCETGDCFLIGSNRVHLFRTDKSAMQPLQLLSLFFREEIFAKPFGELPELIQVKELIREARSGIQFAASLGKQIRQSLLEMKTLSGAARLSSLFHVLHLAAVVPNRTQLSPSFRLDSPKSEIYSRLNRITKYVAENFHRPISLDEAAQVVNLSKYAFCRYFKRSTHRSFVHYLNEFRVRMACRLLSITAYSISQISLSAGFNNLSHFNRQFKKIMRCTPSEYRKLKKVNPI